MGARYVGRHTGRRRPADGRHLVTALLWVVGTVSVAVIVLLVVGVVGFLDAMEHPQENGFADWLCSGGAKTCGP